MQCSFEACDCPVTDVEYCGPTCRQGIGAEGEPCKCGHSECSATIGSTPLDPQDT